MKRMPGMMRTVLFGVAVPLASSLQPGRPANAPTSRRAALSALAPLVVSPLLSPLASHAEEALPREGGAFAATCMGFGCNSYAATDFNGLAKADAPAGAMPYPEFLAALKAKKVEGVIFQPPAGDVAYALIGGKSVRIGEGWPVEVSNSWSSPTWVVRILQNEGVPYAWNFDLDKKYSSDADISAKYKSKGKGSYQPYQPGGSQLSTLRPDVGAQPEMNFTPSAQ